MKRQFFLLISLFICSVLVVNLTSSKENQVIVLIGTKEGEHQEQQNKDEEYENRLYSPSEMKFWIYLLISISLVILAGLFSGLTVGYLSIDRLQLEVKSKTGNEQEKAQAAVILPILDKHHKLLATLLVSNAFCMESLPIFLHGIVPAYLAIVISCVFVIIFGEIIPQAYCVGPQQLSIAYSLSSFVNFLITFLTCITTPIAKILDHFLGTNHSSRFNHHELKTLIELHQINHDHHNDNHNDNHNDALTFQETQMIVQTIDLRTIPANQIMIPISKVFMINNQQKITLNLIKAVKSQSFSKIPIYNQNNSNIIMGILKSKLLVNSQLKYLNKSILQNFHIQKPIILPKTVNLLDLLMIFQKHKTTIALLIDQEHKFSQDRNDYLIDPQLNKKKIIGLVALKDIFECLIQKELKDDDFHNYHDKEQAENHQNIINKNDLQEPLLQIKS